MYTSEELTMKIRSAAEKKGINLKELSLRCGLSINALYQIRGKQGLSCFNLAKLADELECSTDYLLGRADS